MKRCEKYGFKTGEEMVTALINDDVQIKVVNERWRKDNSEWEVCQYLNEEIETNFEHYKKEYADNLLKLQKSDYIFHEFPMNIHAYFNTKAGSVWIGKDIYDWLNQVYKP